jgi:aminoglycoside phosphotransferase (APT) family kinase protein
MKITSTDIYLSQVVNALENTLIPELSSNDAKATAGIVKEVLTELRKRESYTPRLLEEHIAKGKMIAARMTNFLVELDSADRGIGSATASGNGAGANGSFQSLTAAHGLITTQIFRLADALMARRAGTVDAAQQQQLSDLLREAANWECEYYVAQRAAVVPAAPQPPAIRQGAPLTRESLETFLRTRHPDGDRCSVSTFEPVPGGFSKQTFRTTLLDGAGNVQTLIVRKNSPPVPLLAHGGFLIHEEFQLLKDVHASGLPVAEPLYLGVDVPGIDADFYVMTALPGKVPGTLLGGATAIPEAVVLHLAELLARLHSLKPAAFTGYLSRYGQADAQSDTVESSYRRQIAEWKAYLTRVEHLPSPYMIFLLDWLAQNVPRKQTSPVMVHGDFNIHNVLVEGDRITGILDWECSNFGTPEQDLSYIKPHISNHISWDRFVSHYRAHGGPEIDDGVMNFCLVFSLMRTTLGVNKVMQIRQQGFQQAVHYAMAELGFAPEFMSMGLAATMLSSASSSV